MNDPQLEEVGLAEALFDNEAEWQDELAFKRGEILRVIDQNPANGLAQGWWICADKNGKFGIAPANRLKMLHNFMTGSNRVITPRRFGDVFMYGGGGPGNTTRAGMLNLDEFFRPLDLSTGDELASNFRTFHLLHDADHPFEVVGSGVDYNLASPNSDYKKPVVRNVPIHVERRDSPTHGALQQQRPAEILDGNLHKRLSAGGRKSPPPPPLRRYFYPAETSLGNVPSTATTATSSEEDDFRNASLSSNQLNRSWYDSPSSLKTNPFNTSSGKSTQRVRFADQDSTSSENASERSANTSVSGGSSTTSARSSSASTADPYDVPRLLVNPPFLNSTPTSSGISGMHQQQQSTSSSFLPGNGSSAVPGPSTDNLYDSPKNNGTITRNATPSTIAKRDTDIFTRNATATNPALNGTPSTTNKTNITSIYDKLPSKNAPATSNGFSSSKSKLSKPELLAESAASASSDNIGDLKTVENTDFYDDYDFVDGAVVAGVAPTPNPLKTNGSTTPSATSGAENSASNVSAEAENGQNFAAPDPICPDDAQIFNFYVPQIDSQIECLSNAIDQFLTSVENNDMPKIFVGRSRFVILAAHKLVYMGDSVCHCLKNLDGAARIKQRCDRMCDVLKRCVSATKRASQQYPSVSAMQAMVDSMVQVSHVAHEFKLLVRKEASML